MTPYPHPAANLAVFQARLSQDIGVDNTSYTLECGDPIPTNVALADSDCDGWAATYNTMVDMQASGALVGIVHGYLYNRLDIGLLALPPAAAEPYLRGPATTVLDLLPEFNHRTGLNIQPQDVDPLPLPECDCACKTGTIGVPLRILKDSLLFIGSYELHVINYDVALNAWLLHPFLSPPEIPALTP